MGGRLDVYWFLENSILPLDWGFALGGHDAKLVEKLLTLRQEKILQATSLPHVCHAGKAPVAEACFPQGGFGYS